MNLLVSQLALTLTILATIYPASTLFNQLHSNLANHVIPASHSKPSKSNYSPEITYKPYPYKNQSASPYTAPATSAVVYDVESGQYLYQKNPNQRLAIASITKIATALVILKGHKLDETMTVPEGINLPAGSERAGISPQEQFTVNEALHIMLIKSANDMAEALAIWDAGSQTKFVDKMNQQTQLWGLKNTKFANPTGLDQQDHYSSASDLVILSTVLLHNNTFKDIVNKENYIAKNLAGQSYNLTNTNKLLGNSYIHGIKTGLTAEAGQTLVTLAEKNDHRLIGVVLDSPNRFQESKNMIDWAFANYSWK